MAKKSKALVEKPIVAAAKELLRVVVLAVIPVLIIGLENGKVDAKTLYVIGAIAALRFIDKYLHKSGKAEKGLTRF